MIGLLKTLAIIAFVYYAVKFISPYIKRYAFKKLGEKLEQQMRGQFGNQGDFQSRSQQANDKRKEGEIRLEKKKSQKVNPASQSKHYNTQNMGEYVDYEEVKD